MCKNLTLYNTARTVPKEALKEITAGRLKGFTDINPMWRIKKLTELFGPCGIGWWYEITGQRVEPDEATGETCVFVDVMLFYEWEGKTSRGVPGTGGSKLKTKEKNGPYVSDECFKMALTDALSVAAKAIGVAADVYYAKDRDKYTAPTEPEKIVCSVCGEEIRTYIGNDGKKVSAKRLAEGSIAKYGRVLCLECIEISNEVAREG